MNADAGSGTGSVRRARRALFTDPAELDGVATATASDGEVPIEEVSARDETPAAPQGGSTPHVEDRGNVAGGDVGGGMRVRVECSVCGAAMRQPLAQVVAEVVRPFSWWVPTKRHSRWLRCRACGSRAWCRVEWRSTLD